MAYEKILVVDDSPTEMNLITTPLQKKGYQIITATDGDEAVAKATSEQPALILLDIVMPKKDGFMVCRELKKAAATQNIKVILVSSKAQETDRYWGLKQGADDYITKPFDEDFLLNSIAKIL